KTLLLASAAILSTLATGAVKAAPLGGTVTRGEAAISVEGNTTTIDQTTDRAVIDWNSFNLASDEVARFNVPSATSATLNRINDGYASTISGSVVSNGTVYFANPNGLVFDATSRVTANGFFATTSSFSNIDSFMTNLVHVNDLAGFHPAGAEAKIIVNGSITAAQIEFVGPKFEFGESSRIEAQNGNIAIILTGSTNYLSLVNHGTITATVGKNLLARHNGLLPDLGNISIQNLDIRKNSTIVSDGTISAATELTIYGGSVTVETLRGYLVDVKARYGNLTVKDVVADTLEIENSRSKGHYNPVIVDGVMVSNYLKIEGGYGDVTVKNVTLKNDWQISSLAGLTVNNFLIFNQSIQDIIVDGTVSASEINVGTAEMMANTDWFKSATFSDAGTVNFSSTPPATLVSYIDLINQRVQIVDITPVAPTPSTPTAGAPTAAVPAPAAAPAPIAPPAPVTPTVGIPQTPIVINHAPIKPVGVVTTPPVVVVTPPPVVV
ncbi:MAG: filamentous hemagglutinin N-terminal domain-containing protein, partial [Alphaproteobacteria bacterium]|nr:filamentous hemagglutinin N-terminal domain-containing protein [Alphaproteobacteria bacterium]